MNARRKLALSHRTQFICFSNVQICRITHVADGRVIFRYAFFSVWMPNDPLSLLALFGHLFFISLRVLRMQSNEWERKKNYRRNKILCSKMSMRLKNHSFNGPLRDALYVRSDIIWCRRRTIHIDLICKFSMPARKNRGAKKKNEGNGRRKKCSRGMPKQCEKWCAVQTVDVEWSENEIALLAAFYACNWKLAKFIDINCLQIAIYALQRWMERERLFQRRKIANRFYWRSRGVYANARRSNCNF